MENQYYIFLAVMVFLLISIFKWIDYLSLNNYIVESFQQLNNSSLNNSRSHSVDLPLTTTYSCSNFCGPKSTCAKTGQQCFTDVDCPGCQPLSKNYNYYITQTNQNENTIVGDNAAGKLTFGQTPQYSDLTSDIGTKALPFLDKEFSKTLTPTFGVNTWRSSFDAEQKLFDKRYKPPSNLENMPSYSPRYSVTGDFIENGPLASNALL
jgi:hypothetical protein